MSVNQRTFVQLVTALYLGLFAAGLFFLKPLTSADAALAARFSRRAGIVVERLAGTQEGTAPP